jgi:hypothetical protein
MPAPRPGSVTAAAVLAIVYGSLGMLCGLCGVAGLATQGLVAKNFMPVGGPNQPDIQKMQQALEQDIPGYRAFQIANPTVGLALSFAILLAGIGLLGMKSWARTLALVICVLDILWIGFLTFYQSVYVMPVSTKAAEAMMAGIAKGPGKPGVPPPAQMEGIMKLATTVGTGLLIAFYVVLIIYLLIIVILLGRAHVRAAFAGEGFAGEAGSLDTERLPEDHDEGWPQRPEPGGPPDDRYP